MSIDDILAFVSRLDCPLVELTGGEPLAQPPATKLLTAFCEAGFETLLETNGSLDISQVDPRVVRIVDIKCPDSGQADRILWSNIPELRPDDEVKFVIASRTDYEFAKQTIETHRLSDRCTLILSPAAGGAEAADLAEWIIQDKLPVRLGLQLHKIIWPDADRGV